MKKVLFCSAVLFLVFAAAAFAERAEVEAVVSAFEAIVVEAEKLAEMPLVAPADFAAIDDKAKASEAAVNAVANERGWLINDARQIAALKERFNQAMAAITQKLLRY
ncbi:MAG: hypothetical protein LBI06_03430 [Treponema sp.]|jgi:hypothetical protein|nr:hypothetical protein [Treponema sp.]